MMHPSPYNIVLTVNAENAAADRRKWKTVTLEEFATYT